MQWEKAWEGVEQQKTARWAGETEGDCCWLFSDFKLWYRIRDLGFRHVVAQMVKNLPATPETQVRSLGREAPLEEGMTTHSRILA